MKARVKATNALVEVEPYYPPQEEYDCGLRYPFEDYYITSDKAVFSNYDLDFDVEEETDSDLRISVAKLREVLESLVADGLIEPVTMNVDQIIEKVKSEI